MNHRGCIFLPIASTSAPFPGRGWESWRHANPKWGTSTSERGRPSLKHQGFNGGRQTLRAVDGAELPGVGLSPS